MAHCHWVVDQVDRLSELGGLDFVIDDCKEKPRYGYDSCDQVKITPEVENSVIFLVLSKHGVFASQLFQLPTGRLLLLFLNFLFCFQTLPLVASHLDRVFG